MPITLVTTMAFGHGDHKHANSEKTHEEPSEKASQTLITIDASYRETIKPIFTKKCFDCHSDQTKFPWYANIPGVKQLINDDISEAKEHLDMSKDFPFTGHGTPEKDLEEIAKVTRKEKMPPWRYWIIHWDSQLTEEERRLILDWTTQSLELLKKNN